MGAPTAPPMWEHGATRSLAGSSRPSKPGNPLALAVRDVREGRIGGAPDGSAAGGVGNDLKGGRWAKPLLVTTLRAIRGHIGRNWPKPEASYFPLGEFPQGSHQAVAEELRHQFHMRGLTTALACGERQWGKVTADWEQRATLMTK